MPKVLILNGMHAETDPSIEVEHVLDAVLRDKGFDVQAFVLHEREVRPCLGCFGCWVQTPGRCLMPDVDDIAQAFMQSDLAIYLTPLTFGGYSSQLKKVVDHLISLILPYFRRYEGETHHQLRYKRYPKLLGVGIAESPDEEETSVFTGLVHRNALNFGAERWAAGVVGETDTRENLEKTLTRLLAEVEVA